MPSGPKKMKRYKLTIHNDHNMLLYSIIFIRKNIKTLKLYGYRNLYIVLAVQIVNLTKNNTTYCNFKRK